MTPEARPGRLRLIDSHAHLQSQPFDADRGTIVEASFLAGVERLLIPGWDAASSVRAVEMATGDPRLDAAVGVHPHDAFASTGADWDEVVRLATDPGVVAIGETGLDFDRMHSPREAQLANLRRHLRLALERGKPAILHCRSAAGSGTPRTLSSASCVPPVSEEWSRARLSEIARRPCCIPSPARSTTP